MDSPHQIDIIAQLVGIIRAERNTLIGVARREGIAAEDALDCVQDAFCCFLRLAITQTLPENPEEHRAYLIGIVRNAARNKRRMHHNSRPHEAYTDESVSAAEASDQRATDQLIAEAEDHVRLRACVDQLCDTQKAVVTLRVLEEQHGEDVASALGISRAHVDVLLHRAKQSLVSCMNHP